MKTIFFLISVRLDFSTYVIFYVLVKVQILFRMILEKETSQDDSKLWLNIFIVLVNFHNEYFNHARRILITFLIFLMITNQCYRPKQNCVHNIADTWCLLNIHPENRTCSQVLEFVSSMTRTSPHTHLLHVITRTSYDGYYFRCVMELLNITYLLFTYVWWLCGFRKNCLMHMLHAITFIQCRILFVYLVVSCVVTA